MSGSDWPLPIDEDAARREVESTQALHASRRRQDQRDARDIERQRAAGKRDAEALLAGQADMRRAARRARRVR